MVKIACQTIVFSNSPLSKNFAELVETVRKIGYDGIETGAMYFKNKVEYYRDLFARIGLKLAALHTGGNLLDKTKVDDIFKNVKESISVAKEMGCANIYLSGYWDVVRTLDDFATEAGHFREIGKMCSDAGLVFSYHNHNWEFAFNGEGYKIYLDKVEPEYMKLVPDVSWVEIAGLSSVDFVKKNIDRIEAFHFKDYVRDSEGKYKFTELGRGLVPMSDIYSYIAGLNRDWWISAEQDRTDLDPAEAARINFEYIADLRSKKGV